MCIPQGSHTLGLLATSSGGPPAAKPRSWRMRQENVSPKHPGRLRGIGGIGSATALPAATVPRPPLRDAAPARTIRFVSLSFEGINSSNTMLRLPALSSRIEEVLPRGRQLASAWRQSRSRCAGLLRPSFDIGEDHSDSSLVFIPLQKKSIAGARSGPTAADALLL